MMGKRLVKVPYYSMVNLVAGRRVVAELIQNDMTPARLAAEALALLDDDSARESMRCALEEVAQKLAGPQDPLEVAASTVETYLKEEMVHA
jgi:lipid-A-disaccharide synthase